MDQTIFNIAVAVAGFLGSWVLKVIWEAVKELQTADKIWWKRLGQLKF